MGKRSDYDSGRMDGLLLAQKIVRADGIEALDNEIVRERNDRQAGLAEVERVFTGRAGEKKR